MSPISFIFISSWNIDLLRIPEINLSISPGVLSYDKTNNFKIIQESYLS